MSTALQLFEESGLQPLELARPVRSLPIPWRDPHTISPTELAGHILALERACERNPQSADLRTCLGMAYAMNFEVYKSMDALEAAVQLDDRHFFAQFKYAELLYRLRALSRSEEETLKALDLASNVWEYSLARKQLQEIRRLTREGTQRPAWVKPLQTPAVALVMLVLICCLAMAVWR